MRSLRSMCPLRSARHGRATPRSRYNAMPCAWSVANARMVDGERTERSERSERTASAASAERSERRAQRAQRAPSAASAERSERRAQGAPSAASVERSERRAQRASSAASAASAERSERRAQRAPSAGSAERSERRAQRAQRAPSAASAGRSERRAQREPGASSAASPERSERRAPQRGAASAGRSGAQRVPGAAGRSKHNTRSGRRARQPLSPLAVQMRLRPPGATACGCACGGSRPLERKPLRAPLAAPGERIRRTTLGRTRAPGCAQAHAPLAAPTPLVVHAHPCPLRHGRHPRGEGSPAVGWVQLGAEPQGSRLPTLVDHAQPGAGQRRLVLGHRVLASAAALRPEARRAVPSRVALEEQQHRPRVARSGQPAARQAQGHHRQRGAEEEP